MFLASAKLRGGCCQVEGQCQAFQGPAPIVVGTWAGPLPAEQTSPEMEEGHTVSEGHAASQMSSGPQPGLLFLFLGPDAA